MKRKGNKAAGKGNKAAGKGNKAAGKGKDKQRQVQRCPSDQSSASDDDCVFRIGPSAPNDAQNLVLVTLVALVANLNYLLGSGLRVMARMMEVFALYVAETNPKALAQK